MELSLGSHQMNMRKPNPKQLAKTKLSRVQFLEKRLSGIENSSSDRELFDYLGIASLGVYDFLSAIAIRAKHQFDELEATLLDFNTFVEKLAKIWANGCRSTLAVGNGKPFTCNGWEWKRIPKKDLNVCEFPFGTSALISLLSHHSVPNAIAEVFPSPAEWSAKYDFNSEYFVDGGFVEMLAHGKTSQKWRKAVACYAKKWESDLYEPSMLAYADIIQHANAENWTKSIDSLQRSIELWELRAADKEFPEFQSWEGGGVASFELLTDLRLCVILRRCFSKKRKLLGDIDLSHFGNIFG